MGFTIVEAHEPHGSSVLQFMSVDKLDFFLKQSVTLALEIKFKRGVGH